MEMNGSVVVPVPDASAVAVARRAAAGLASAASLDETDVARVALVATEAASNLVKHAGGGEILLRRTERTPGVEVLALDRGHGMCDPAACFRDGYSTAGTPGTGLGAIRRAASLVDIYSGGGTGTVLLAQVKKPTNTRSSVEIGAVCVPHPYETECGDGWTMIERDGVTSLLVVDGLGHGTAAHAAAEIAIESFTSSPPQAPGAAVESLHDALRSTRGAAVAVAQFDARAAIIRFCGIGNIRGAILAAGKERWMLSHNGTAGHRLPRVQEFSYPWPEDSVTVLHSDGVASHWNLESHRGLLASRHPAVVAGLMYRDFRRTRDDATVIAARHASPRRAEP